MIKRIIMTVLLICLILGTALAQNARAHIAQGQEHMRNQNYAEAVASFEAALNLDPRNRQAPPLLREAQEKRMEQTFNQAQGLQQAGNYTEAIAQYNLAIRFAPAGHNTRNIQARRSEAERALQERQQQEARALQEQEERAQAQTARERAEQSQEAVQKANDYFLAGNYANAVIQYEHAVKIGGLTDAEVADTQRLVETAKDIQTKMEAFSSRALRDDDFDVSQNRDGSVTILKYKAFEKKTVNIKGTNHTVFIGFKNIVIPSRIFGVNATIIGPDAFKDAGLTSVIIPETIVEIGAGAFAFNNLERVTLGVRTRLIRGGIAEGRAEVVLAGAFEGNAQLTQIVIPDTVTEIGAKAFKDCGLISVTLGRAVSIIGESAFRNNNLTVITLPASVRRIGRYAFNSNQIQSLTIPNGVELVSDDAFTDNPMTAVVIPASLAQLIVINAQQVPRLGGDHVLISPHVPSFPTDSLVRVTLPANVQDRNMNSFEENLRNFYTSQNRAAGTYVKNGPIWTRQ